MRLRVGGCKNCGGTIYIAHYSADDRKSLCDKIGSDPFTITCGHCKQESEYGAVEVFAERPDPLGPVIGATAIGGVLGLSISTSAMFIGCVIGFLIGVWIESAERKRIANFNKS